MKVDRDTKTEVDLFFRRFEKRLVKKYGGEPAFIQYIRFCTLNKKMTRKQIINHLKHGIRLRKKLLKENLRAKGLLEVVSGLYQRVKLYSWYLNLRAYAKGEICQLTKWNKDYTHPFKLTLPKNEKQKG